MTTNDRRVRISVHVGEYAIPPLKDMLVLGRNSPIGCIAMRRAIELLVKTPFEHIELDDEVISDILVRQSILRRLSREELIDFVVARMKPMMGPDEVLHALVEVNVFLSSDH
ncbi:hypothetical protein [Candidatus Methylomicrobium oryzae]|jgi:hypothetical protein|uniref:hypothetical protein n=1 Tax=Candidatus Methylomicrobium oryzae TaxID=2802053 RepID=UPI001922A0FD|nr:hypothetical protein [Methylomicrobium sp. RS1]MBL1262258.1 hypothetical protein [Methylomicrobium sp. RS1]